MSTTPRTYSRQVIAAWLHGYSTGHNVGWHEGRIAGFTDGYDVGHTDGIPVGRDLADEEAAARFRDLRAMSAAVRPNRARSHTYGPAKPLQTPTECLATWSTPGALHSVRHAA